MRLFLDDADTLRQQIKDDDGNPVDLTGASVKLDLIGPARLQTVGAVLSPRTDGWVQAVFPVGFFPRAGDYTGRWQLTFASTGRITSATGVAVRVYEPNETSKLYANLLDLEGYAEVENPQAAMTALEAATNAVKGYMVTQLDPTLPVPSRVRQATAIIAARLYTSPNSGAGTDVIASETIGDYRVAYQNTATGAGLSIAGDGVLANLLAPWHPRIVNAFIGPDDITPPLAITYADADVAAWDTAAAALTEGASTMLLDFTPTNLDMEGVRAGDRNERTFTLTSEGAPVNLLDCELIAQARKSPHDVDAALTAEIIVTDAVLGTFTLSWPGDQVEELLADAMSWTGLWDLQVRFPDELLPITMLAGNISCIPDVSR